MPMVVIGSLCLALLFEYRTDIDLSEKLLRESSEVTEKENGIVNLPFKKK